LRTALTAALISDACREEVDIILKSAELKAVGSPLMCDSTITGTNYRPDFCANDVLEMGTLESYKESCENTLGMQIYQVDTWRVCQNNQSYYILNDAFCVGKSCSNETEIREVLAEVVFPSLDQSLSIFWPCNTTYGEEGSQEKCNAQTQVLPTYPSFDDFMWKDSNVARTCRPDLQTDCRMDYTSQFDYDTVQRECEQLGYRYLKIDHTWDCVNSTAVGSTFQYNFLNEPYCAGSSCSGSVPDYFIFSKESASPAT
jgi:hypothetical protein